MSADPAMLWRFPEVASGRVKVVSFSDAHSHWPWRIGREATIFDVAELSYEEIVKAIRTGVGLKSTIETPPEYGKYHYDGHRACDFTCSPVKTKELDGKCPVCNKDLTIGVDYRVLELSEEEEGFKPSDSRPFHKILPLHELIVMIFDKGISSKGNWAVYDSLIEKFKDEFNVLLRISREELVAKEVDSRLVDLIIKNRNGSIKVRPGYDGVYGEAVLSEQKTLF